MTTIIESLRAEYLRYKALAEGAMAQVGESELSTTPPGGGNSIATVCWHLSGNLQSRFTDFLTSDGEKPWRNREEEFEPRSVTREELIGKWNRGWDVLQRALDQLADADLSRTVRIRGQELLVHEALHRSVTHASYHAGQIVFAAKAFAGDHWRYLSIAPGGSAAYNQSPTKERPASHVADIKGAAPGGS
jgi:hypothetical protein